MKWYTVQFDKSWVMCRNYKCRNQFLAESIKGKKMCPSCRMNNDGSIKPTTKKSLAVHTQLID